LALIQKATAHFGVPVISSNMALAKQGLKRLGLQIEYQDGLTG
jgi:maleate cis-trans isomerase